MTVLGALLGAWPLQACRPLEFLLGRREAGGGAGVGEPWPQETESAWFVLLKLVAFLLGF